MAIKPTSMSSILSGKPSTVKKSKKKAAKKPAGNMPMGEPMMNAPKRVTVEKAGNGFTVSDHMGGKQMVAKSHAEMMRHVKGMMGE